MADTVATFDLDAEKGPIFKVLHTTARSQTALMTVPPGDEAGPAEVHPGSDQVFHVVEGRMRWRVWTHGTDASPEEGEGGPGTVLVVPAGIRHWVASLGDTPLFFLTVYSPPAY
ncbi:MAG: cupin domain-containing protein [Euryarchaeota archaeon]|nr:cupin domain-containing protein [Euryarchaeota archaeon]